MSKLSPLTAGGTLAIRATIVGNPPDMSYHETYLYEVLRTSPFAQLNSHLAYGLNILSFHRHSPDGGISVWSCNRRRCHFCCCNNFVAFMMVLPLFSRPFLTLRPITVMVGALGTRRVVQGLVALTETVTLRLSSPMQSLPNKPR